MSDEADNVLRFPSERRREPASEFMELIVPEGVSIQVTCTLVHVFVNGADVCQCGMAVAYPDREGSA